MRIRFVKLSAIIALATVPCLARGTITTYAGNASCCHSADGRPATSNWLPSATGIAVDRLGNLYIWEGGSSRVRKVNPAGIISTVAGNGIPGYSGDGGPATSEGLRSGGVVSGLAADASGNLYLNDGGNQVIRNAAGIISTFAGTGTAGFSGDGGPATSAQLDTPAGVAVDNAGNVYIADSSNNRIRMVNAAGIISGVAGNGSIRFAGDGGAATAASVDRPTGVAVDGAGNLYISETSSRRVRKVDTAGIVSTVAGVTGGTNGFSGDGGPATSATLYGPVGLAVSIGQSVHRRQHQQPGAPGQRGWNHHYVSRKWRRYRFHPARR